MALEQVTPVVPQGTFSVTMRKVPLAEPLTPQWSWDGERRDVGPCPRAGSRRGRGRATYLGQRVLAAPLEAVALSIKGDEVAVPVGHTGAQAGLVAAFPPAAPAGAVGRGEVRPCSGGLDRRPPPTPEPPAPPNNLGNSAQAPAPPPQSPARVLPLPRFGGQLSEARSSGPGTRHPRPQVALLSPGSQALGAWGPCQPALLSAGHLPERRRPARSFPKSSALPGLLPRAPPRPPPRPSTHQVLQSTLMVSPGL